jgi:hypothetical protein
MSKSTTVASYPSISTMGFVSPSSISRLYILKSKDSLFAVKAGLESARLARSSRLTTFKISFSGFFEKG